MRGNGAGDRLELHRFELVCYVFTPDLSAPELSAPAPADHVDAVLELAQQPVAQSRVDDPAHLAGRRLPGRQLVVGDLCPGLHQYLNRGRAVRASAGLDLAEHAVLGLDRVLDLAPVLE